MIELKNNRTLAQTTQYILLLVAVFSFLSMFRRIFMYYISEQTELNKSVLVIGKLLTLFIAWPRWIFVFGSIILFLTWFYKTYQNLYQLPQNNLNDRAWMAIGGFIIPGLNLFKPHRMLGELWDKLQENIKIKEEYFQINHSKWIINVWWAFHLTSVSMFLIVLTIEIDDVYIQNFKVWNTLQLMFDVALIPTAWFGYLIVKRIADFERKLLEFL